MTPEFEAICETVERLLASKATKSIAAPLHNEPLDIRRWAEIEAMGLPFAAVPEAAGGAGLTIAEMVLLMETVGRHAEPLPIAETLLGNLLLASANLPVETVPLAVAGLDGSARWVVTPAHDGLHIAGQERRVPWVRAAGKLVILCLEGEGVRVIVVQRDGVEVAPCHNLALEPRDDIRIDMVVDEAQSAVLPADLDRERLFGIGAAMRTAAMAGSIKRVLDLTIAHANDREQFGRPIAQFQIIQQYIAMMAGHLAAAKAAAAIAAASVTAGFDLFSLAAAKVRVAEAARAATALAHQVHGAIGFTAEYDLHRFTTRLWAWRDEFGSEAYWAERLGELACLEDAALWNRITQMPKLLEG